MNAVAEAATSNVASTAKRRIETPSCAHSIWRLPPEQKWISKRRWWRTPCVAVRRAEAGRLAAGDLVRRVRARVADHAYLVHTEYGTRFQRAIVGRLDLDAPAEFCRASDHLDEFSRVFLDLVVVVHQEIMLGFAVL